MDIHDPNALVCFKCWRAYSFYKHRREPVAVRDRLAAFERHLREGMPLDQTRQDMVLARRTQFALEAMKHVRRGVKAQLGWRSMVVPYAHSQAEIADLCMLLDAGTLTDITSPAWLAATCHKLKLRTSGLLLAWWRGE
jgi:hypothetical protein